MVMNKRQAVAMFASGWVALCVADLLNADPPPYPTYLISHKLCRHDYPCPTVGSIQCKPNPGTAPPDMISPWDDTGGTCFVCKNARPQHKCEYTGNSDDSCSIIVYNQVPAPPYDGPDETCGDKLMGLCPVQTYPVVCQAGDPAGPCFRTICPGGVAPHSPAPPKYPF